MNKSKEMTRVAILASCLLIFIIAGCSLSRSIIVTNQKATMPGLYEINSPPRNWNYKQSTKVQRGVNSAEIYDMIFTTCPGPKIIVISRAVYGLPGLFVKKRWSQELDPNSIENIALCYLDEFYHELKTRKKVFDYEFLAHRNIQMGYNNAVEVICKSKEIFTDCEGERKEGDLMNKFIVIESRDRSSFRGWGSSPRMIVFWYGSPVENYEEGLAEFDKMVQSFRFIKN